jgi:hypothetical protein
MEAEFRASVKAALNFPATCMQLFPGLEQYILQPVLIINREIGGKLRIYMNPMHLES